MYIVDVIASAAWQSRSFMSLRAQRVNLIFCVIASEAWKSHTVFIENEARQSQHFACIWRSQKPSSLDR